MSKILPKLHSIAKSHVQHLFLDWDTVRDGDKYGITKDEVELEFRAKSFAHPKMSFNRGYLFPVFILLYLIFDSIYVACKFSQTSTGLETLLFHRIFPKEFWNQAVVMVGVGLIICFLTFLCLLLDPKLNPRYFIYSFVNEGGIGNSLEMLQGGKVLNSRISVQIYRFRKKVLSIFLLFFPFVYLECGVFWFWNFFVNQTGSWYDWFLFPILIVFLLYCLDSDFFMGLYFLLNTGYFTIKQKTQMVEIDRLYLLVQKQVNHKGKILQRNRDRLWCHFNQINGEIDQFYQEISAQNALWSKYLTLIFVFSIIEIVYFVYVIFFVSLSSGGQNLMKAVLVFCGLDYVCSLLAVTWQCSRIIKKNCVMARQMARIALKLQSLYRFPIWKMLKIDQQAANYKNIPDISFKLLGNYQINSQMFQLLFTYTSVLFMMIFRKQEK